MKPLLPATSSNQYEKIILVENDKVISDPRLVAEVFNEYFANIVHTENSNESNADFSSHPSVRLIAQSGTFENFTFHPVSTSYVRDILNHLNPKKAVGVDGITPRLLRLSAPCSGGRDC